MILQKSGDLRSTASRDGSGDRVIGNREIGSSGHRRRGWSVARVIGAAGDRRLYPDSL